MKLPPKSSTPTARNARDFAFTKQSRGATPDKAVAKPKIKHRPYADAINNDGDAGEPFIYMHNGTQTLMTVVVSQVPAMLIAGYRFIEDVCCLPQMDTREAFAPKGKLYPRFSTATPKNEKQALRVWMGEAVKDAERFAGHDLYDLVFPKKLAHMIERASDGSVNIRAAYEFAANS